MATFSPASYVWVLDEEERFLPAKVLTAFKKGEATTVELDNGQKRPLTKADMDFVCECFPEAMSDKNDDMVNISDLNEMAILHQLRIRFKVDKIYTYISSILISVNPFKMIPLYTPEYLEKYRTGDRSLPPHAFAVANNAYNNMLNESQDQCVVCSGESGAGKSEATKVVLQFLTDAAMRNTKPSADGKTTNLAQMIMSANPILEAFGNAKTLRNNNSSRFGKLITMKFDRNGGIVGGAIINYLLEKSRVVMQIKNERNYHIFYQVLANCQEDAKMSESLKLKSAELFDYLNTSGVITIPGVNDKREYDDVYHSMVNLNFSEEERMGIWKMVSGVLYFGNIKYVANGDNADISNADIIPHAAAMWGIDPEGIKPLLITRIVGGKEKIVTPLSLVQALDTRDALTKKVYGDTFQWTVDKINLELSNNNAPFERFIGVLDIFGFESFEINSFEQLCINFCNEKLQFHFNTHIFKMEQALYQQENIILPDSSFKDNQPTLDLIELKGTGIIPMLDDEINVPKGSDDGFLAKIIKTHEKKHPNFLKPGPKDCKESARSFGVLHYAGAVYYYVNGWLDKNKDQISIDIQNLLRASASPFMQAVFPPEVVDPKGKSPPKLTLGTQFKNQLNNLIDTLNSTFPQFVRCMKSNNKKTGGIFEAKLMQDQLRYAGLVEVCRIRKLGFPVRRVFTDFYKRYKTIEPTALDLDALLKVLKDRQILKEGEWAKGTTRVFYRMPQAIDLEIAREKSFLTIAIKLQKKSRGAIVFNRHLKFKEIIASIKSAIKARTEDVLDASVKNSSTLPYGGTHLPYVTESKQLLARVKDENRVLKLIQDAIAANELQSLKSAVEACNGLNPPFAPPVLAEAKDLIVKIEAELAAKAELTAAITAREANKLSAAIEKAKSLNFECAELQQAQSLLTRIDEENDLLKKIKDAIADKDVEELAKLMTQASSMGMQENQDIQAAGAKLKILEEEEKRDAADETKQAEKAQKLAAKAKKEAEEAAAKAAAEAAAELAANPPPPGPPPPPAPTDAEIREKAAAAAVAAALEQARKLKEAQIENARKMEEEKVKRLEEEKKATAAIEAAMRKRDSLLITEFLDKAMRMGLFNETVRSAQQFIIKDSQSEDAKKEIQAALKVLRSKAETGLTASDLIPLRSAIAKAKDMGFEKSDYKQFYSESVKAEQLYTAQAEAMDTLVIAYASNDRVQLRHALDKVQNLCLVLDIVEDARLALKDMDIESVAERAADANAEDESLELTRTQLRGTAKEPRFHHKNFPGLRRAGDYASGSFLLKLYVMSQFLNWQSSIPKSLTTLSFALNKRSLEIHEDLLGYMGDKVMTFPAMLARDVLKKGLEFEQLRDEIFLQIIKQLTKNANGTSIRKGWELMCLCVGTFLPSKGFTNYLLHFLLNAAEQSKGVIKDYARYSVRALEAMIQHGTYGSFMPSVEEIESYSLRPPVLATIELVDGTVVTENLPVSPDTNVGTLLDMCAKWLDLKDPRTSTFGLFIYDMGSEHDAPDDEEEEEEEDPYAAENAALEAALSGGGEEEEEGGEGGEKAAFVSERLKNVHKEEGPFKGLIRTPRPLRNDEYLGDVISAKKKAERLFKIVYKKKIFFPHHNERGNDPFYERLVYLQAIQDLYDDALTVKEEKNVVAVAAAKVAITYADDFPLTIPELLELGVSNLIIPSWFGKKKEKEWGLAVYRLRENFVNMDIEDLQDSVSQLAQADIAYGMHWFYVYKVETPENAKVPIAVRVLPKNIILGINTLGLHVYNWNYERLASFSFADIMKWGGSASRFSIIMIDTTIRESYDFDVITSQSADIASILLDHIKAYMSVLEKAVATPMEAAKVMKSAKF